MCEGIFMLKIKSYRLGFDIWGLILFLLIMIPNFIWFAIPAPSDILREESDTPFIDSIASFFQVLMIIALCLVINSTCKKPMKIAMKKSVCVMLLIYYIGWVLYYSGITDAVVIMILCIAPCIAFIIFSFARKNIFAVCSAFVFSICHLIYGFVNFVLTISFMS